MFPIFLFKDVTMNKVTYWGRFASQQFVQAPKIHLELSENRLKNFHLRLCENVAKGCRQKKKTVNLKTLSKLRLTPLPPTLDKFIFDTVLIMLTSLPPLYFLTKIM